MDEPDLRAVIRVTELPGKQFCCRDFYFSDHDQTTKRRA